MNKYSDNLVIEGQGIINKFFQDGSTKNFKNLSKSKKDYIVKITKNHLKTVGSFYFAKRLNIAFIELMNK